MIPLASLWLVVHYKKLSSLTTTNYLLSVRARSVPELRLGKKCSCGCNLVSGCSSFSFWMVVLNFVFLSHLSQGFSVTHRPFFVESFFHGGSLLTAVFTLEDCWVCRPLQTKKKVHWSVCELQIGFWFKISKFRSIYVSWLSFLFLFKTAI